MTTFKLKSVAELLDGQHHFYIPSYQRGYRWESKQVLDLLNDLAKYAREEYDNLYCLQPLVVKPRTWEKDGQTVVGWEVIDGQQRLTTLWFILNRLRNEDYRHRQLYTIDYETRPVLDISEIYETEAKSNIDSFYMFNTQCVIDTWTEQYAIDNPLSKLRDILFVPSKTATNQNNKVAQFIWYELDTGGSTDLIDMFNSLNYGRISLTSSELIKALFVLNVDRSFGKSDSLNKHRISAALEVLSEWNLMEQKLQDENFWKFLTNDDYNPPTRIDIIFDFLTNKPKEADKDFSYRKFQDLYDGNTDLWKGKGVTDFDDVWDKVRDAFYMLLSWYNDLTMYHLIGYLIYDKTSLNEIFQEIKDKQKHEQIARLKEMIKDKLGLTKSQLEGLTYKEDSDKVRKVILLFNLITCNNANYRFSFDNFKGESWDIEHLSPQTKNPLTDNKDRLQWLTYASELTSNDLSWGTIKLAIDRDKSILENDIKKSLKDFDQLYAQVTGLFKIGGLTTDDEIDKIWNLTLLDAGTNRGYGNALFPTKRMKIIEADESMKFVPICTRNMILKYYTKSDRQTSQFKNQWTQDDAKAYLEAIVTCLDNSKLLKTDSTVATEEQQKQ